MRRASFRPLSHLFAPCHHNFGQSLAMAEERAANEPVSLPEIKSGYIGDGDRQGLDGKECFQPALPRAISAHPCPMTSECACRCNSPYRIAARGADGVRQIPRCDPCIPCGSNRSTVLHKRFAKVSEETSGDLEYRWT